MSSLRELYVGITFDADPAIRELDRLNREIDRVTTSFGQLSSEVNFAGMGFSDFASDSSHSINNLSDSVVELNDDIDDFGNEASDSFKDASREAKRFAGITGLITAGLSGGIATVGTLVGAIGGIGSSFAAAGIGAVGFGVVATSALGQVFDAAEEVQKLEEKIANASSAKERIKAQKELAAVYADMSREEKGALTNLQEFKTFWGGFVDQFKPTIFNVFGKTLDNTQKLLDKFAPTIHVVGESLSQLADEFGKSLGSSEMKGFFDWLNINAGQSLYNFSKIFGNTFMGVTNLMRSFAPIGESMEDGLVNLTQRFREWTWGLKSNAGFQSFMDYVKTNGPVLINTFSNVLKTIGGVVSGLAPLGTVVLKEIEKITGFATTLVPFISGIGSSIKENWGPIRETLIGIGVAAGTLYASFQALAFVKTITGLITAFKTSTFAATWAQHGFNAALKANPIGLVITAVTLLVTAGVMLYRNWDTVKEKAGQLWGVIKEKFGLMKDWIIEKLQPVKDFFNGLKDAWDGFKNSLSNFKMPKIGLPKWMGGNGLIQAQTDGSHATGLARVPFDGYTATVHKDEAILTAKQSNALRDAGILNNNGGKPVLDMGGEANSTSPNSAGSQITNHFHMTFEGGQSSRETAEIVRREIEQIFTRLNYSIG